MLVGISITNRQQIIPGLALARRLRAARHFVVIGGAVFSKFRGELLARPEFFSVFADAVVVYEGETALLALVDALANGTSLHAVPNLLFLEGNGVVATMTHVEDVPSLPTPDFTGFPLADYLSPSPVLPILTGKGCYFNRCKFCDIPHINHVARKPYRIRRPEQVIADLHQLQRAHAASHFVVTDEALSPKLLLDLADAFDADPGHFALTGYARPEPGFTPEVCGRIARVGFRKLFFGVESGSQATLDHMDKAIQIARVPEVLANCRSAGIDFHLFGIIGLPEETALEARKTLAFIVDNKSVINRPGTSFDVHPFGLELRTEYFKNSLKYGIRLDPRAFSRDFALGVDDADWRNTNGLSSLQARQLIETEMTPMLRETFRDWHATPNPLWPPQEEYSVLYRSRFDGRPFPWRSCLPDDDATPFEFSLDRFALGQEVDGGVNVDVLAVSARIPAPLARILSSHRCLTLDGHVASWPDAPPVEEIRTYIEALIELGLLSVKVESLSGHEA
jgi:anaerobic magnesium-protoporphyrin IX monomethyl ester cyclase